MVPSLIILNWGVPRITGRSAFGPVMIALTVWLSTFFHSLTSATSGLAVEVDFSP